MASGGPVCERSLAGGGNGRRRRRIVAAATTTVALLEVWRVSMRRGRPRVICVPVRALRSVSLGSLRASWKSSP